MLKDWWTFERHSFNTVEILLVCRILPIFSFMRRGLYVAVSRPGTRFEYSRRNHKVSFFFFFENNRLVLTLSIRPSLSNAIQDGKNLLPNVTNGDSYPNMNSLAVCLMNGWDFVWRMSRFTAILVIKEVSDITLAKLCKKIKENYWEEPEIRSKYT